MDFSLTKNQGVLNHDNTMLCQWADAQGGGEGGKHSQELEPMLESLPEFVPGLGG